MARKKQTGADRFAPARMKKTWLKKQLADPAFKAAYDALDDEFALLGELLKARRDAGLTQSGVAKRMGRQQSAVARLEGGIANRKHSPTLATLRDYADACGKKLQVRLVDV